MSNLMELIGGGGVDVGYIRNITTDESIDFKIHGTENLALLVTESATITITRSGEYILFLSGGGGSGASSDADTEEKGCSCGGGSGFLETRVINLTSGQEINVLIGSGGDAVYVGGNNDHVDGNDGGNTDWNDGEIIANGGKGGLGTHTGEDLVGGDGYCRGGSVGYAYASDGETKQCSQILRIFQGITTEIASFEGGAGMNSSGAGYAGGGGASILANGGHGSGSRAGSGKLGSGGGGQSADYDDVSYYSGAGGDGFALLIYKG